MALERHDVIDFRTRRIISTTWTNRSKPFKLTLGAALLLGPIGLVLFSMQ